MTRERLLDKLAKLMRQRDGEAAIGNIEAAEAFAGALNRMLLKHELDMAEVELRAAAGEHPEEEPVDSFAVNPEEFGMRFKRARSRWQEQLAAIVARAHLCQLLVTPGTNLVAFVGTEAHARCAVYSFGTLAAAAERMSLRDYDAYWNRMVRERGSSAGARGYRASWLVGFVRRIRERLEESTRQEIHASRVGESVALVRVQNSLTRAQRWVEGRKIKAASELGGRAGYNPDGRADGRAAADRVPIGQRGVGSGRSRGQLGEGGR